MQPWHFAALSNISLQTFVSNLVSLICPLSPGIGQNSGKGISDFRISGQYLLKENCHNFRTSSDIEMKLGPATKLDKRNRTKSRKWRWRHFVKLWRHCNFSNLWSIRSNPDSGRMICKTFIFINNNLLSYKIRKQN